jgi:hypothetical protein
MGIQQRFNALLCWASFVGLLVACGTSATPLPTSLTPTPTPTFAPTVVGVAKPPEGKYLFVEVAHGVDGSGKLYALAIDFPMYRFDKTTGVLKPFAAVGSDKFVLLPAEWGFVGDISYRRGAAGTGGAGDLRKIVTLPAETTITLATGVTSEGRDEGRSAPVTLTAVSSDGKLEATVDGERITLAAEQAWSRSVSMDVATIKFNGRYTITSSLVNYGWQDRAKIQTKP